MTASGLEPPLPRPRVSAIVLAGGRSSRFGSPKLDAELDGSTLLDRAIRAAASVAGDVVVAGPAAGTGPGRGVGASIRFVVDDEPFGGPLAALVGALRETSTDLAIVVGGDMPSLVPGVLASMLQRLESAPDVDAAHLASPTPTPHHQVLPLAIRVARVATAAVEALAAGDRSLVRLLECLRTVEIPASEWLALDPTARTLFDVDDPADLERWQGRRIR